MNLENDVLYQIALLELDQVGPLIARRLIETFGSAEAVFKASKKELHQLGSLGISLANGVKDLSNLSFAEAQLTFIEKQGGEVKSYYQKTFPNRLKQCNDAPLILYQKGFSDLNHTRMIAVVGTRQATAYGKNFCESLIQELKQHNVTIVSGLAFGIDACAHRMAVSFDVHNIAVMAHGLDRIYPSDHRNLASEILNNGALLTEYPIHTNPDRENFPKRNRIVAGMVDAVIVVESSVKGGSMITARLANDYSRDVFALPGRIGDVQSEGCNLLIKSNQAHLIYDPADIVKMLGWKETRVKGSKGIQKQLFLELTEPERKLVSVLQENQKTIDEIAAVSGIPMSSLSTQLLMLELNGVIKQLPGKVYALA